MVREIPVTVHPASKIAVHPIEIAMVFSLDEAGDCRNMGSSIALKLAASIDTPCPGRPCTEEPP